MKVNSKNDNLKFSGIYNNKILKKGLEFASNNSYLCAGTTSLALSLVARPMSIMATPNTDEKNKKIACAKAYSSSIIGYLITLAVSLPFAKSVSKINKNPKKYLQQSTIDNFKKGVASLSKSNSFELAKEMFKLGLGLVVAAPKAVLTALGVPVVMKTIFKDNKKNCQNEGKNSFGEINFKGKNSDVISNGISKVFNKKWFQDFTDKYKDTNFPMHLIAITDVISTLVFTNQIKKQKNMDTNGSKTLAYNALISTGLSIISGYAIDMALKKPTEKFIQKFEQINKNDPKLTAYLHGIKVAKPILIFGVVYYVFIPMLSTYFAERIDSGKKNIIKQQHDKRGHK